MTTGDGRQIHVSTKKVKKRKSDNNATVVTDEPNNEEVSYDDKSLKEPKKKKRKKMKETVDCIHGDMESQTHEEVADELPATFSKNKKKKKKREVPEADVDNLEDVTPVPESAGKKKKKHKHKHEKDCSEAERYVENNEKSNGDIVEVQQFTEEPKRKKKKKSKHKETNVKDGEMKSEECSRSKKHRLEHGCTSSPVELDTNAAIECQPFESSNNRKKKKKKRKYEDEDDVKQTDDDLSLNDSQIDGNGKKKKKKKKHKSKNIEDRNILVDNSIMNNGLLHTSQEVDHGDALKLKKKKKHVGTDSDESKKTYNSFSFDYSSMDKRQNNKSTKSQSLDNSREGTGQNQGVTSLDANSGQWGTASFESEQRQQKFLRLLGGFRKGGSTESKPLFGKLGKKGGNCALNHEEEASLNVKLETEFDRAMSFRLSKEKSGGLGFQAPPGEGKKFYIDKTSSKSIKFNDSD